MLDDPRMPRPTLRPSLPPVATYLRATLALGRAAIGPALPALALLYFYRLGMGLYLAMSMDPVTTFEDLDRGALATATLMRAAGYLPLVVLIYAPFLLLLDGILRGVPRSFGECVRTVLERMVPFLLSAIAQILIVFGPPVLLLGGAALLVRTFPGRPEELARAIAIVTLIPCFFYIVLMLFLLWFAFPVLVLDRRGPLQSIRISFGLVAAHFGGILGRLLVTFFLLVIAAVVLSLPAEFLQVGAAAAGADHPAIKIAMVVWTSAVSALLFPFLLASLMVMYRSIAPAPAGSGVAAGAEALPEPHRATSPFQFE
jgi:hypothetical protein